MFSYGNALLWSPFLSYCFSPFLFLLCFTITRPPSIGIHVKYIASFSIRTLYQITFPIFPVRLIILAHFTILRFFPASSRLRQLLHQLSICHKTGNSRTLIHSLFLVSSIFLSYKNPHRDWFSRMGSHHMHSFSCFFPGEEDNNNSPLLTDSLFLHSASNSSICNLSVYPLHISCS